MRPAHHHHRRRAPALIAAGLALLLSQAVSGADVFKGRQIYESYCQHCHGAGGRGAIPGAPNFTRGMALMRPDPVLLQSIAAGRNAMPGYQGVLDTYQMLDVIAYLRTLR